MLYNLNTPAWWMLTSICAALLYVAQAYVHLKTLLDFSDMEDV